MYGCISGASALMLSLGYTQLRNVLRGARRKWRVWRRVACEDRGLLEASVEFTRKGTVITDLKLLERLRVAFKRLGVTNLRVRVLLEGTAEATKMLSRYGESGVFSWVPQLEAWLKDQTYRFWLGTMQLACETPGISTYGLTKG